MKTQSNRRSFLKHVAMAGGAVSASHLFSFPAILRAGSSTSNVNCAVIGCGNRGRSHLSAVKGENLVAVVDVDDKRLAAAQDSRQGWKEGRRLHRLSQMFDKLSKQIDAVFVATPNHQHALPTMIAMQLGKGVYCEKPLCHDIAEARKLAQMAAQCKVATQMGNQGHCQDGYRRLCEYVWAGAIGKITETYSWTNRANGGRGPRPPSEPVPAGLHWDEWIGPAPFRDFHEDLHPHEWHGWYDFGNGSLGNLACHVLMACTGPSGWSTRQHRNRRDFRGQRSVIPTGTTIRWDFPARGDMPALKAYWYDGRRGDRRPGRPENGFGQGHKKGGAARDLAIFRRCCWNCSRSTRMRSSTAAARSTWVKKGSSTRAPMATTCTSCPRRK